MATKVNRQWLLAKRPLGLITESNFEWNQEPLPTLGEGQILVRNIYLSLDPTNRGWLNEGENYLPPVAGMGNANPTKFHWLKLTGETE